MTAKLGTLQTGESNAPGTMICYGGFMENDPVCQECEDLKGCQEREAVLLKEEINKDVKEDVVEEEGIQETVEGFNPEHINLFGEDRIDILFELTVEQLLAVAKYNNFDVSHIPLDKKDIEDDLIIEIDSQATEVEESGEVPEKTTAEAAAEMVRDVVEPEEPLKETVIEPEHEETEATGDPENQERLLGLQSSIDQMKVDYTSSQKMYMKTFQDDPVNAVSKGKGLTQFLDVVMCQARYNAVSGINTTTSETAVECLERIKNSVGELLLSNSFSGNTSLIQNAVNEAQRSTLSQFYYTVLGMLAEFDEQVVVKEEKILPPEVKKPKAKKPKVQKVIEKASAVNTSSPEPPAETDTAAPEGIQIEPTTTDPGKLPMGEMYPWFTERILKAGATLKQGKERLAAKLGGRNLATIMRVKGGWQLRLNGGTVDTGLEYKGDPIISVNDDSADKFLEQHIVEQSK